jgi:hypothetical protein
MPGSLRSELAQVRRGLAKLVPLDGRCPACPPGGHLVLSWWIGEPQPDTRCPRCGKPAEHVVFARLPRKRERGDEAHSTSP